MEYIIDRIEKTHAVLEHDGKIYNVKLKYIPKGAVAGDVLQKQSGKYIIDKLKTQQRKKVINKLQDDLFV